MTQCFICKKKFSNLGSHMYKCAKENSLKENSESLKLKQLEFKHKITKEEFVNLFNLGYSFKNFKTLGIDLKACKFLFVQYELSRSKEETEKIKQEKRKQTSLVKYGVTSPNSSPLVQAKKEKTLLEKYGVSNPVKVKGSIEKAENTKLLKYGAKHLNPFRNKTKEEIFKIMSKAWEGTKTKWRTATVKDKQKWIELLVEGRSTWWKNLSESAKLNYLKSKICSRSKLEFQIENYLNQMNIEFEIQKWIANTSFDFYFPKNKVILEIQGNYWHGNPKIYKETDYLLFPLKTKVLVKNLWDKDKNKKLLAESYGYKVFYLWEDFIKSSSENTLKRELLKIYNLY